MRIGATTLGYLYRASLAETFASFQRHGYVTFELAASPPHLDMGHATTFDRQDLKRLVGRHGLQCVTVNPIDINLISAYADLGEFGYRQLLAGVELAHELEAPCVAFSPGRRHALMPCPLPDAIQILRGHIERLLPTAERLGVELAVETVPFGWLQTGREVAEFVATFGDPRVGLAYDPPNTLAHETTSVEQGLLDSGDHLKVVHISGSWRNRWAHTTVREGDIDWASVGRTLQQMAYAGPTIYELADGEDPDPRFRDDLELLERWGWTQAGPS